MADGEAKLRQKIYTIDSMGQRIPAVTELPILVTEKSLTRAEYYAAGKAKLNAKFILETPKVNYSGEDSITYNGKLYNIYRTYPASDPDLIELYLEEVSNA